MSGAKRITIILILAAVVIALFAAFLRQQYVAPIIMYHSVGVESTPQNRLNVSKATFTRQMRFLKEHRYNVIPLEKLADLIKLKKRALPKTIAITFDDGYKNVYTNAFGVLKKYNFPATMFIIINEVDRSEGDRLSWGEIKTMQDSGLITFGSHALDPEPLVNIKSDDELKRQVFDSKKILEEKIGPPVKLFSYPEGLFNQKIRQLAIDAGYSVCAATNPGRDYPDDDVFALKRLRISENAANMFVFGVEVSGYYTHMKEFKKHKDGKR